VLPRYSAGPSVALLASPADSSGWEEGEKEEDKVGFLILTINSLR